MRIVGIAGKAASAFHLLRSPREDGDTVVGFLAVPDRAVARLPDCIDRKLLVGSLQFLKSRAISEALATGH
jgi:hypothetical protein